MSLADETCKKVPADSDPLSSQKAAELAQETPDWAVVDGAILREFRFAGFRQAMDFVNSVANMAEEQNHHPDILVSYDRVRLTLSTHKIGGLSRNDFVMAAKIDQLEAPKA